MKLFSYEMITALLALHFHHHNNKIEIDGLHGASQWESGNQIARAENLSVEQKTAIRQAFDQLQEILTTLKEIKKICLVKTK